MDDHAGLIALVAVSAIAVAVVFAGLLWAAVQDGRDEAAFRTRMRAAPGA